MVRATGGLEDTVRDYNDGKGNGNGFKFREYSARALVAKVREAVEVFKDKKAWRELQKTGMGESYSWENSARRYTKLYAIAQKRCIKFNQSRLKNTPARPSSTLKT